MNILITKIKKVDLKKIMKKVGIASHRQLAIKAGINYQHFLRVVNGSHSLSESNWKKIKVVLNKNFK